MEDRKRSAKRSLKEEAPGAGIKRQKTAMDLLAEECRLVVFSCCDIQALASLAMTCSTFANDCRSAFLEQRRLAEIDCSDGFPQVLGRMGGQLNLLNGRFCFIKFVNSEEKQVPRFEDFTLTATVGLDISLSPAYQDLSRRERRMTANNLSHLSTIMPSLQQIDLSFCYIDGNMTYMRNLQRIRLCHGLSCFEMYNGALLSNCDQLRELYLNDFFRSATFEEWRMRC